MLETVLNFLRHLTWKRYWLAFVTVLTGIALYTLFENRQVALERVTPAMANFNDDIELSPPGPVGQRIIADFARKHPEIALITLIDADPVRNLRLIVYRHFSNDEVKRLVEAAEASGTSGQGPLITSDEKNNRQVLAILSGEFYCTPVGEGAFGQIFREAATKVTYSCRAPLPPAFGKSTGWFSIHITKWPVDHGFDTLKFDALSMSLNYFNAEIAQRGTSPRSFSGDNR
jgi:hypothetical protein